MKPSGEVVAGVVREALPNAAYRVELEDGRAVVVTVAGKMRMDLVRVIPGDQVKVEVSPFDRTKGRIVEGTGTAKP